MVAGALCDARGRVLIAQRPLARHLAGRWEFPGGKVGSAESESQALVRELREELGVEVREPQFCLRLTHAYPDRTVELSFWIVREFAGSHAGSTASSSNGCRPRSWPGRTSWRRTGPSSKPCSGCYNDRHSSDTE